MGVANFDVCENISNRYVPFFQKADRLSEINAQSHVERVMKERMEQKIIEQVAEGCHYEFSGDILMLVDRLFEVLLLAWHINCVNLVTLSSLHFIYYKIKSFSTFFINHRHIYIKIT